MASSDWNPNPALEYTGLYPRHELQRARNTLIQGLKNPSAIMVMEVMPKCGIATRFGRAHVLPPLPKPSTSNNSYHSPQVQQQSTSSFSTGSTRAANTRCSIESYTTSSQSDASLLPVNKTPPPQGVIVIDEDTSPVFYSNINGSNSKKQSENIADSQPKEQLLSTTKRKLENTFDEIDGSRKRALEDKEKHDSVIGTYMVHDTSDDGEILRASNSSDNVEESKAIEKNDCDQSPSKKPRKKNSIPFLGDSQSESEQETEKCVMADNNSQPVLEKIRTFSVWTSNDAHGTKPVNIESIYKCDTCSYASKDDATMKKHLEELCHYSASSYKAVIESSQILLVSVFSMLEIVNEKGAFTSQIVMCPDCQDVFKDIFMCGLHHKKMHGSLHGRFTVCPVVADKLYQCDTCKTCPQENSFQTVKQLLKHFREYPSHNPHSKKLPRDHVMLYVCGHKTCSRLIYNNYPLALSHADVHIRRQTRSTKRNRSKNSSTLSNNKEFSFNGREIIIPKISQALPPHDSTERSALWNDLAIMVRLRHFYNHVMPAKTKRARNLEDIRALRSQLGCAEDSVEGGAEQESMDSQAESEEVMTTTQAPEGWTY